MSLPLSLTYICINKALNDPLQNKDLFQPVYLSLFLLLLESSLS